MPINRKPTPAAARGGAPSTSRPGANRPATPRAGGPGRAQPAPRVNAAPPQGAFMSLDPSTYTQGGLLDDIDVTFHSVRFVEWDYGGRTSDEGEPILTLALLVSLGYDDNGKEATADQYFSAGDINRFQPSEDGTHAVAVGNAKGMSDSTNCARFIKSIIDAGFPADQFGDGDVSVLDGMVAHVNRVPQERGGSLKGKKNASGYDPTVMVVTNIIQMPWETSPAPQAASARPTTSARPGAARPAATRPATQNRVPAPASRGAAASPSDNGDQDLTEEAAGILVAVLDAKNGSVLKGGIASGAFKPLTGNPNRSGILALITDDDWLYENGEQFGWSFDGKAVTAG